MVAAHKYSKERSRCTVKGGGERVTRRVDGGGTRPGEPNVRRYPYLSRRRELRETDDLHYQLCYIQILEPWNLVYHCHQMPFYHQRFAPAVYSSIPIMHAQAHIGSGRVSRPNPFSRMYNLLASHHSHNSIVVKDWECLEQVV